MRHTARSPTAPASSLPALQMQLVALLLFGVATKQGFATVARESTVNGAKRRMQILPAPLTCSAGSYFTAGKVAWTTVFNNTNTQCHVDHRVLSTVNVSKQILGVRVGTVKGDTVEFAAATLSIDAKGSLKQLLDNTKWHGTTGNGDKYKLVAGNPSDNSRQNLYIFNDNDVDVDASTGSCDAAMNLQTCNATATNQSLSWNVTKTPGVNVGSQLKGSGGSSWSSVAACVNQAKSFGHVPGLSMRYVQKEAGKSPDPQIPHCTQLSLCTALPYRADHSSALLYLEYRAGTLSLTQPLFFCTQHRLP